MLTTKFMSRMNCKFGKILLVVLWWYVLWTAISTSKIQTRKYTVHSVCPNFLQMLLFPNSRCIHSTLQGVIRYLQSYFIKGMFFIFFFVCFFLPSGDSFATARWVIHKQYSTLIILSGSCIYIWIVIGG